MDGDIFSRDTSVPSSCSACGGELKYTGTGEYKCRKCGFLMYDDYGRVRLYLEDHKGASVSEIAKATRVSPGKIRTMVKDARFELTKDSALFLFCERCGSPIRSGRYCDSCLLNENGTSSKSNNNIRGVAVSKGEASGAKRFERR